MTKLNFFLQKIMNWGIFHAPIWVSIIDALPESHWWRLKLNKNLIKLIKSRVRNDSCKNLLKSGHVESFYAKCDRNLHIYVKMIGRYGPAGLIRLIPDIKTFYALVKSGRDLVHDFIEEISGYFGEQPWLLFQAICRSGREDFLKLADWRGIKLSVTQSGYFHSIDSTFRQTVRGGNINIINFMWENFNLAQWLFRGKTNLSSMAILGGPAAISFLESKNLFTANGFHMAAFIKNKPEWIKKILVFDTPTIKLIYKSIRRENMAVLEKIYGLYGKTAIEMCLPPKTIFYIKTRNLLAVMAWLKKIEISI
jgi:hypothetical protein